MSYANFKKESYIPQRIQYKTYSVSIGGTRVGLYFISDRQVILIDSGRRYCPDLINYLESNSLEVKAVIQTHLHIDHIANSVVLHQDFGAQIIAAQSEPLYKDYGSVWDEMEVQKVHDNGTLNLYGESFEVVHIPGHSAGQWLIITPDGVGFAGDAILSEEFLKRTRLPYMEHINQAIESMKIIQKSNLDFVVAAHNGVISQNQIKRVCQLNIDKEYELYNILQKTINSMLMHNALRNKSSKVIRSGIADRFMLDIGIYSNEIRQYEYMHDTVNARINELMEAGMIKSDYAEFLTEGK